MSGRSRIRLPMAVMTRCSGTRARSEELGRNKQRGDVGGGREVGGGIRREQEGGKL